LRGSVKVHLHDAVCCCVAGRDDFTDQSDSRRIDNDEVVVDIHDCKVGDDQTVCVQSNVHRFVHVQASGRGRSASCQPGEGLVGRGGVEPPTFRFSGGRSYQLSYLPIIGLAVLMGLEPTTSALTGRRALQLLHRTLLRALPAYPQRDSNPCYRLERAASWAARRWGRRSHHRIHATLPVKPPPGPAGGLQSIRDAANSAKPDPPQGRGCRSNRSLSHGMRVRYAAIVLLRSPPPSWERMIEPARVSRSTTFTT
jgi:hypothetical protein